MGGNDWYFIGYAIICGVTFFTLGEINGWRACEKAHQPLVDRIQAFVAEVKKHGSIIVTDSQKDEDEYDNENLN